MVVDDFDFLPHFSLPTALIIIFFRKSYLNVFFTRELIFQPTEFSKIALATLIGFAIMGFIGFFVKLIHIPINNIL